VREWVKNFGFYWKPKKSVKGEGNNKHQKCFKGPKGATKREGERALPVTKKQSLSSSAKGGKLRGGEGGGKVPGGKCRGINKVSIMTTKKALRVEGDAKNWRGQAGGRNPTRELKKGIVRNMGISWEYFHEEKD